MLGSMNLARISRGAFRTQLVIRYKLSSLRRQPAFGRLQTIKKIATISFLSMVTTVAPVLHAQATAAASDGEPPSISADIVLSAEATTLNTDTIEYVLPQSELHTALIGKSADDLKQEEIERQKQLAEQHQAELARQATLARERYYVSIQAPRVSASDPQDMVSIITAAAQKYGVNADLMLRIARCESGLRPNAHNASGASGLFQFLPSTFANSPQAQAGGSIMDAQANAEAAAYKLKWGTTPWISSQYCWSR